MEKITRYPSIAAIAAAAEAINPVGWLSRPDGDQKWLGGERIADSLRYARVGNDSLVPEAERLLSQINAAIDLPERPMVADCVGAYPIVPDYLMGVPDCMRRRAVVESDESPIAVYVDTTCDAKFPARDMLKRGVAILALVMAVAPARPIDLHIVIAGEVGGTDWVITAPINTRPLDLAGACYALTSMGFTRGLGYALIKHAGRDKGIGWQAGHDQPGYHSGLLARLGGDPARDLILPAAHPNDPIVADPVRWVNAQLDRFREVI